MPRPEPNQPSGPRRLAAAAIVLLSPLMLAGCRTVTGEFFLTNPPPTPEQAVAMTSDRFDPDRRRIGMTYLMLSNWATTDVYVSIYTLLAEDPDPTVRVVALRAIGRHGGPEQTDVVVGRLQGDEDPLVRRQAALTLQRYYDPSVIEELVTAMNEDEDAGVRAAAAAALGQFRGRVVLEELIVALDDEKLEVAAGALRSLRILTGQIFDYHPVPWLDWLQNTDDPFADGIAYTYQTFDRDPNFIEIIFPFVFPPSEPPDLPRDYPPPGALAAAGPEALPGAVEESTE
jgi:HEAT repeat protein